MKRVIEHGQPKKNIIRRFVCTHCGCVFEADAESYKHVLDRNEEYFYSTCPECDGMGYAGYHG